MSKLDISLTPEELDAYLLEMRTARLATTGPRGPHVVPLWYAWHDRALFFNTTLGNLTVENLERERRAAAVVDDGEDYGELRGAVLSGPVSRAEDDPRLEDVKEQFSRKYHGGNPVPFDRWRNRLWLRLDPDDVASWDFRKIPEARARRDAERARRTERPEGTGA